MRIENVKLSKCSIDYDFKEVKENLYVVLGKAIIGEDELENIVYLEFTEEQYNYINNFNYKEELFDIKGSIQIKQNKKGISFIFAKVNYVIAISEKIEKKRLKVKKIKENVIKNYIKNKSIKKNKSNNINNWIDYIPNIEENLIRMKLDKVKLCNKIHKNIATINLKHVTKREIVAVKPIEDTDEYELLLGYATYVRCKLLNLEANVYIVDKTRKEFLKYIEERKVAIEENSEI